MTYLGTKEFFLEVRRGNVGTKKMVSILGHDESLDTTKIVVYPTGTTVNIDQSGIDKTSGTPATVKVSSTSANDTSAGTGMRTARLTGLDANGDEQNETITMNGTNAVTSSNTYSSSGFILEGLTWGSSNYNEGTVWIGAGQVVNGVPVTPYASMEVQLNKSETAYYVVPNGKNFFPIGISATTAQSTKSAEIYLETSSDGLAWINQRSYGVESGSNLNRDIYNFQGGVAAGTHIRIAAAAASQTTDIMTELSGILIDA